jgi:hypothetical protein
MPLEDSKVERKQIKLKKDQIQYRTSGYQICPSCEKDFYVLNLKKCLFCNYNEKEEESQQRNIDITR